MHRGVCVCVEHVGEQLEFDRHYFFRNIPSFPFPPLPLEESPPSQTHRRVPLHFSRETSLVSHSLHHSTVYHEICWAQGKSSDSFRMKGGGLRKIKSY